jgi:hypothetical protein
MPVSSTLLTNLRAGLKQDNPTREYYDQLERILLELTQLVNELTAKPTFTADNTKVTADSTSFTADEETL